MQASNLALASDKIGVILIKLIDYSGKLPSGPVKKILTSQPRSTILT